MKRIAIYNLEPELHNYALDKVRCYYLGRGDDVSDYFALDTYDEIWASAIFPKHNKGLLPPQAHIGGTGLDVKAVLPSEIDAVNPRLNYGFTTRGCTRKCPFCIVPQKEGRVRFDRNLLDLWDGSSKSVTLYDNNILALPEHFRSVCQESIKNKITIDFNQGLDHRLLTDDIVDLMTQISHKEYKFAFDQMAYKNSVANAIDLLQSHGIKRCQWYVLVGYDTTFDEDLWRLNYLRSRNQNVFVQRYNSARNDRRLTALAKWGNQHHIFQWLDWHDFLNHPDNKGYKKLFDKGV